MPSIGTITPLQLSLGTAAIEPIQKLQSLQALQTLQTGQTIPYEQGAALFTTVFADAIDNVKQTDAEKNKAEYLLATGQLDNPALLTIANTKAQLSVELLIQLRNKALDTYNEIIRMGV